MNSGDRCAFEGCSNPLFDPATGACIGDVCHINGKQPGSPRYDPEQTDEIRNGYDNLVLMCAIHARVIDYRESIGRFTVEVLSQWKSEHESRVIRAYSSDDRLRQLTVSSSTDAVARSLLSISTGVSSTEAAVLASVFRNRQLAAVLAGSSGPDIPLPLRESAKRSQADSTDTST